MVLRPKMKDLDTKIQNSQDFQTDFSSNTSWTRNISSVKFRFSEAIDGSSTLHTEELPDLNQKIEEMDRRKVLSTSV